MAVRLRLLASLLHPVMVRLLSRRRWVLPSLPAGSPLWPRPARVVALVDLLLHRLVELVPPQVADWALVLQRDLQAFLPRQLVLRPLLVPRVSLALEWVHLRVQDLVLPVVLPLRLVLALRLPLDRLGLVSP